MKTRIAVCHCFWKFYCVDQFEIVQRRSIPTCALYIFQERWCGFHVRHLFDKNWPGLYKLVGLLVVFNVPSTARSFRDGTPISCPLRRINTPFRPGFEPWAVAWQSITLPLRYASSTQGCTRFMSERGIWWKTNKSICTGDSVEHANAPKTPFMKRLVQLCKVKITLLIYTISWFRWWNKQCSLLLCRKQ